MKSKFPRKDNQYGRSSSTARNAYAIKSSKEQQPKERVCFDQDAKAFSINMISGCGFDDTEESEGLQAVSMLTFDGFLEGIAVIMAVDSGAMTSVLARHAASRLKIEVVPTSIVITLANGWTIKPDGITNKLEVNIDGFVHHRRFIVMEHLDHDILLGSDFLNETRAIVSISERYLKFPGTMVYSSNAVEANEGNTFIYNTSVEEESELFEMHDFEEKYRIKSETQLTDDEFNEFKKLTAAVNLVSATSFEEFGDCTVGNMTRGAMTRGNYDRGANIFASVS